MYTYKVKPIKTKYLFFANYCYILVDNNTNDALIIDPAWELQKIIDALDQIDARLKGIILTHSHYDHVNLVAPLINKFNANVYMSQIEIDYYKFRSRNLYALNDMDRIKIGETMVTAIHTPGHTLGGMCYLLMKDSLFTGDTIFIEGCGACTFKGGSAEQMFNSIQRIKAFVPLHALVYPGHSYGQPPGQTMEFLNKENIYFQIKSLNYFVNFRMRRGKINIFEFR